MKVPRYKVKESKDKIRQHALRRGEPMTTDAAGECYADRGIPPRMPCALQVSGRHVSAGGVR